MSDDMKRFEMTAEERERLGATLQRIRKERGLKRTDVARAWGCDQSNVAHAEKGRHNLSVRQLVVFARLAGVELAALLSGFSPLPELPELQEADDSGEAA